MQYKISLLFCILQVATRGVTIYFVLADLAGIDVMYQFSLDWFQDIFSSCICGVPSEYNRRKSSTIGHISGVLRPRSRDGTPPRSSVQEYRTTEGLNPDQLKRHMLDMINR